MWIGVFDSGLGGLALAESIRKRLPQYDYLYLGDTKRVPYGNRSQETIHEFVSQALNFLFAEECRLVILACNTASAEALRKSQQEYLPRYYPERRILGVIIPTAEAAFETGGGKCGVLATQSTVDSGAFARELDRVGLYGGLVQQPAPLLVPVIENDGLRYIDPILEDYLAPLKSQGVETILLGCTHYCLIKDRVRASGEFRVISQDEVVPEKLADYLDRHPEMEEKLSKQGRVRYCVTDRTSGYEAFAHRLVGRDLVLEKVTIE